MTILVIRAWSNPDACGMIVEFSPGNRERRGTDVRRLCGQNPAEMSLKGRLRDIIER
jgi:hypothetical protein